MKNEMVQPKKEGTTMETIGRDISGLPGSEPLKPENSTPSTFLSQSETLSLNASFFPQSILNPKAVKHLYSPNSKPYGFVKKIHRNGAQEILPPC